MKNSITKNKNIIICLVLVGVLVMLELVGLVNIIPDADFYKFIDGDYGDYYVSIQHKKAHRHMYVQGYLGDPNKEEVPFLFIVDDPNGYEELKVTTIWLHDSNDPAADAALYDGKLDELTDTNNLETMYAHVMEHGKER